jgi:putative ABC transport system permease protein
VVRSQVQLGKNVELGFNKDQILVLQKPFTGNSGDAWPAFRNELLAHPQIPAATASSASPFRLFVSQFDIRYEGGSKPTVLTEMLVDYDFFETYEVPLLAGRVFSEQYRSDVVVMPDDAKPAGTGAFVLSRAAVEELGWDPESAVGKWVERDFSEDFSRTVRGLVVGVVEDMRLESLREPMKRTYYHLAPSGESLNYMSLRLSGKDLPETLAFIDAAWARHYPGYPINRQFLDVDFQALYAKEERFIQLLSVFAFLSVAISCLGLFGLTAFTVERKTKEIGVRKVMGGSVWSIVLLLTNDFSKLVLIANVIAWPVAYFTMSRWLESFAYRIDLTPLVFIGSGLIALCIAWVTVGSTAAKAATQKPVLALRYE